MKIYCNQYNSVPTIPEKFIGKDIWIRCTDKYSNKEDYIRILDVIGDKVYYYIIPTDFIDGSYQNHQYNFPSLLGLFRTPSYLPKHHFVDLHRAITPFDILNTDELLDYISSEEDKNNLYRYLEHLGRPLR